jgi:hypothetical protein
MNKTLMGLLTLTRRHMTTKRKKYAWVKGSKVKGLTPEVAGKEIDRLLAKYHNNLPAKKVVDEARPSSSPIHKAFNWNDHAAAEAHRLEQARHLLRSVTVIILPSKNRPFEVRVTTALRDKKNPTQSLYGSTAYILSDPEKRAMAIELAYSELLAVRRKYAHLQELRTIFEAIDGFRPPKKGSK